MSVHLPVVGPVERALSLRSFAEFHSQRPEDLVLLAQLLREQWVRRGTVLQGAGRHVAVVHFLMEGHVRCVRDGRLVQRVAPLEAIGLVELLAGVECDVQYVAETNLLVLETDAAALLDALEEHFSVFSGLRRALGEETLAMQQELGVSAASAPSAGVAGGSSPNSPFGFVERLIWASRSAVLRGFGVGVLASLVRDEPEIHLRRGESLWEAGTEGQFLALIVEGTAAGTDESGRSFRAGAGSVLGVEAVFGGVPYGYTATAETPLLVVRIDAQELLDVAEDHFHVATQMLSHLARALLQLRRRREAAGESRQARGDEELRIEMTS